MVSPTSTGDSLVTVDEAYELAPMMFAAPNQT
jgi:hypothetical protein